jgi:hypothetical protein
MLYYFTDEEINQLILENKNHDGTLMIFSTSENRTVTRKPVLKYHVPMVVCL